MKKADEKKLAEDIRKNPRSPEVRTGVLGKEIARRDSWSTGVMDFGDNKWTKYAGDLSTDCVEGDEVDVLGRLIVHPQYGVQFKIEATLGHLSGNRRGIKAWLEEYLPWIGPVRADELIDIFGAGLWNIILSQPYKLTVVEGITPERADEISEKYREVQAQRDILLDLLDLGLTMPQTKQAFAMWGAGALSEIEQRPYALYYWINGIKFADVDKIALKLGVKKDAIERLEAFAMKRLREGTQANGDCAALLHTLIAGVASDTKVKREIIRKTILDSDNFVVRTRKMYVMEKHVDKAEAAVAYVIGFLYHRRLEQTG